MASGASTQHHFVLYSGSMHALFCGYSVGPVVPGHESGLPEQGWAFARFDFGNGPAERGTLGSAHLVLSHIDS